MTEKSLLGVLIFPDFELLDVTGPLEMFGSLPDKFKIITIAEKAGLIQSRQHISISADTDLNHTPSLDYLLIPGGLGTRKEVDNPILIEWIKQYAQNVDMTLTVCTGSALLAKTGLLDNRPATSNKKFFDWVVQQRPQVKWIKKARWVDDGNIVTASGVAAGIDMSLAIIARLHSLETSRALAKATEHIWNSDPSEDPFAVK